MEPKAITKRQFDHKAMRRYVGYTAIFLSPVVMIYSGRFSDLTSISISYWTDARDIFVGALIAIGFIMFAYNGTGESRDREFWLSKIASVLAIFVALFPTDGFPDEENTPAAWAKSIADALGIEVENIHISAAIGLFACLIALMWFFSSRAKDKGKSERAKVYRCVAVLMGGGIAIGLIVGHYILKAETYLFWVEFWALSLFGIGWLIAGFYRTEDENGQASDGDTQPG